MDGGRVIIGGPGMFSILTNYQPLIVVGHPATQGEMWPPPSWFSKCECFSSILKARETCLEGLWSCKFLKCGGGLGISAAQGQGRSNLKR